MTKKGKKLVTIKQLAKAEFAPYPPEDVERMLAKLAPEEWDKRTADLFTALACAIRLLGKSKGELVRSMSDDNALDALTHLAECCRDQAQWLKAGVRFLESVDIRIMVAVASAAERGAKKAA
jgi:hypothetical protein